jgi:hypothetical protein
VFTPEGKYIRQLALYDDEFAHNLVFSTDRSRHLSMRAMAMEWRSSIANPCNCSGR